VGRQEKVVAGSARKTWCRQCGYRSEQHAPVTYGRNADLLQVLDCQVWEDRLPDSVVEKCSFIFAKAETALPRLRPRSHPPTSMAALHTAASDICAFVEECPASRSTTTSSEAKGLTIRRGRSHPFRRPAQTTPLAEDRFLAYRLFIGSIFKVRFGSDLTHSPSRRRMAASCANATSVSVGCRR
jgi:hypothetical protein